MQNGRYFVRRAEFGLQMASVWNCRWRRSGTAGAALLGYASTVASARAPRGAARQCAAPEGGAAAPRRRPEARIRRKARGRPGRAPGQRRQRGGGGARGGGGPREADSVEKESLISSLAEPVSPAVHAGPAVFHCRRISVEDLT